MVNEVALSLFPGIDGLGLGFQQEWPGLCIVRGPDVIWGSLHDIRTFHPPPGVWAGMFGGPPCQEFSPLSHLVRAQGKEPRFGNLIPEFERCVTEAQPDWWIMEQVPQAPEPSVPGYIAHHLILNNRWFVDAMRPDGLAVGAEQRRLRRISFGTRDGRPLPLDVAALESPITVVAVHGHDLTPSEHDRADGYGRVRGGDNTAAHTYRRQITPALVGNRRAVPVRIGGSGKVKITATSVTSSGVREGQGQVKAHRAVAGVAGGDASSDGGTSVRMARYTVDEAAELQGFPADFLKESPLTQSGRLRLIANAVPGAMARAIARAVRRAMDPAVKAADYAQEAAGT